MSVHLMHEAALRKIKPSAKLVLLCLAEAARDGERRAWPGEQAMRTWAGISSPRLYAVLKDLAEMRLIEQVKRGQKHQRAEYVVFPDGCCDLHSGSRSREAEPPVDSLADKRLSRSQGLVSDPQGLVSEPSASRRQDPSLKEQPPYSHELTPEVVQPRPTLVTAPVGIFDGVRAKIAEKRAAS